MVTATAAMLPMGTTPTSEMNRRPFHIKRLTVVVGGNRTITVKSGLEAKLAKQIDDKGVPVQYEEETISYDVPARTARYTPDFKLANGIIVEGKGEFDAKDRAKHLLVKEQHPDLDIRFVFNNPNARLYKDRPPRTRSGARHTGFSITRRSSPTRGSRRIVSENLVRLHGPRGGRDRPHLIVQPRRGVGRSCKS
jgi:hypothetical protein